MSSFAVKTFAVTRAASGIGRALSLILAERGAQVVLVGVDGPRLNAVADEVGAVAAAVSVVADVAHPGGCPTVPSTWHATDSVTSTDRRATPELSAAARSRRPRSKTVRC